MSKDLNLCQFIGRLGKDVDMRHTAGGDAVANISLACGDDYKDKSGNKVEQTNWIRVVAFGRLAEIMGEYLKKGSQVYISGKQVTRKWQDKEGNDRYTTEIVANEMKMLGRKESSQSSNEDRRTGSGSTRAEQAATDSGGGFPDEEFDDDIPF